MFKSRNLRVYSHSEAVQLLKNGQYELPFAIYDEYESKQKAKPGIFKGGAVIDDLAIAVSVDHSLPVKIRQQWDGKSKEFELDYYKLGLALDERLALERSYKRAVDENRYKDAVAITLKLAALDGKDLLDELLEELQEAKTLRKKPKAEKAEAEKASK